jgi:hypothetical protein
MVVIIPSGCGLVQSWAGPVEKVRPGEKQWHGAAWASAMTHIAVLEHLDRKNVNWLDPVADPQYPAGSA